METEQQELLVEIADPPSKVQDAIDTLRKQQRLINAGMIAVIIVVALGFVATILAVFVIFIEHQDYTAQRYDRYIKLLETQQPSVQILLDQQLSS